MYHYRQEFFANPRVDSLNVIRSSRDNLASPCCRSWWERGLQPASVSEWEKRPGI